jgi:hypothetical protein
MQTRILLLALLLSQSLFAANDNFSVSTDFLYWTISETGTDNWAQVISPVAKNQSIKFLDIDFNWRPGFRVGANYISENHEWETRLYYTWFQTNASNSATTSTDEIHSSFSSNFYANNTYGNGLSGPYYHQASIDWDFLYNSFDWEIGRLFNYSHYKLHPFVGLKAAFLNQSINTLWIQPFNNSDKTPISTFYTATEDIKNNFWGVGPSFGLNAQWDLFNINEHQFGVFGDFSGAFLWGGWSISDIYQNDTPTNISTVNNIRSSAIGMTRALLGVDWQRKIQNLDFIFKLAYEGQAWTNQLKFYSFDGGRQNNTLYIQGGVLNVCIHF